jgi:hypothetical protein
MVCLRNISVDTLHKGDTEDDDNDDNNNNNNNNNNNVQFSNHKIFNCEIHRYLEMCSVDCLWTCKT